MGFSPQLWDGQTYGFPAAQSRKFLSSPARSVYLDLFEGDCREARTATPADAESVPCVCVETRYPKGA